MDSLLKKNPKLPIFGKNDDDVKYIVYNNVYQI